MDKKGVPVMTDLGCGEVLDLSQKGIPTNIIVAMGILMGLLLNVTRRRTSEDIDSFMGGT